MITLCQKTTYDMTAWSHGVGEEREQLMQHVNESIMIASVHAQGIL